MLEDFIPDNNGNIRVASNRDFNHSFLDIVGGREAYLDKDGNLNKTFDTRVKNAVLSATLGNNRQIVEKLLEDPAGFDKIVKGLLKSISSLVKLNAKNPSYELSQELSQAVEHFVEIKEKGWKVDEFLAQMDMFRDKPTEEVQFLMRLFADKKQNEIAGVLNLYAKNAMKVDTTSQPLFADEELPTKLEKLQEAQKLYATDIANQDSGSTLEAREVEENAQKKFNASYNIKDRRIYFYDRKDIPDLMPYNIQNKLTLHSEKDKPVLSDIEKYDLRQKTKTVIEKLKSQNGANIIEELFDIDDRTINAINSFYNYYNIGNPINDGKHFVKKEIFSHTKKHQELKGFKDEVLVVEEDFYLIGEILKSWDYISFRRRNTANTITFEKIYDDFIVSLTEELRTGRRQQGQNKLAVLTIYKREGLASRGSNDTTNLINEHRHPNPSNNALSENNLKSQAEFSAGRKNVDLTSHTDAPDVDVANGDYQYRPWAKDTKTASGKLSPRKINPNARLPETNVSMGDIRRYLSQALDIPIKSEFPKSAKRAGGLYYPDRELIRLKDNYWNDLSVFGHEVFHYLHRMIFGGDNFHHKNVDQFKYI